MNRVSSLLFVLVASIFFQSAAYSIDVDEREFKVKVLDVWGDGCEFKKAGEIVQGFFRVTQWEGEEDPKDAMYQLTLQNRDPGSNTFGSSPFVTFHWIPPNKSEKKDLKVVKSCAFKLKISNEKSKSFKIEASSYELTYRWCSKDEPGCENPADNSEGMRLNLVVSNQQIGQNSTSEHSVIKYPYTKDEGDDSDPADGRQTIQYGKSLVSRCTKDLIITLRYDFILTAKFRDSGPTYFEVAELPSQKGKIYRCPQKNVSAE